MEELQFIKMNSKIIVLKELFKDPKYTIGYNYIWYYKEEFWKNICK